MKIDLDTFGCFFFLCGISIRLHEHKDKNETVSLKSGVVTQERRWGL